MTDAEPFDPCTAIRRTEPWRGIHDHDHRADRAGASPTGAGTGPIRRPECHPACRIAEGHGGRSAVAQQEIERQDGLAQLAFRRGENVAGIEHAWTARRAAQERLAAESERRKILESKLAALVEPEVASINADIRVQAEGISQHRLALASNVYKAIEGVTAALDAMDECRKELNRLESAASERYGKVVERFSPHVPIAPLWPHTQLQPVRLDRAVATLRQLADRLETAARGV